MSDYRIARIVNSFGIRGQVKVIANTDFVEERFKVGQELTIVRDGETLATVTVEKAQANKGTYILTFKEYDNINQIEQFKEAWLMIDAEEQEELPDDEFYHHQIIGLTVQTTDGVELGIIKEILTLGSNDVWVVKRKEAKKRDDLIPYISEIVKEVDLAKGEVLVELMDGLLDDEN